MNWDLHMHSHISLDGEYSPAQLVGLCRQQQLDYIALADHNSVGGTEAYLCSAKEAGIKAITGVELDCTLDGINLHLLGYGICPQEPQYEVLEGEILAQKRKISQKGVNVIREMGIHVPKQAMEALARDGIVTGEMVAEAALGDPQNDELALLKDYRLGGSRSDNPYVNFYWDFFSQGKPAFFPISYPSFQEALSLIHDTGGLAVLAHPLVTVGKNPDTIAEMKAAGLDGMEVYSSYHSREDWEYFGSLADALGLFKTPGSDFHGKTKPSVKLGSTSGQMKEEEKERLIQLFLERGFI